MAEAVSPSFAAGCSIGLNRRKSFHYLWPTIRLPHPVTDSADPNASPAELEGPRLPGRTEDPAESMAGMTCGDGAQDEKLELCQTQIGYRFKDLGLLREALTHASGASHRLASNERLEFLGDAILGLVVCDWLYREYPEYSEGDLTKIKSAVVSRRTCGGIAKQLQLDRCLFVGKGVTRNRSYPKSLVSDVFEAVVASIYIDGGLEAVRPLLHQWMSEEVRLSITGQSGGNHKSALQQYAQRDLGKTPIYRLLTEAGPDHSKSFQVVAVIGERTFVPAWGRNKKEAEQHAAGNAMAELNDLPIPYAERQTK